MLKIFTARENIDTKKFMYERIAAAMTERRVFLIVPEQSTLRAEADAFDYMGVPGFIDFDVLSMTSLGRRIIEEVGYKAAGAASSAAARDHSGPVCDGEQVLPGDQEGGAAGPPGFISKYGKYMLLSRLLYRHKSEMRTFKHLEASPDFVEQLNNMIAELKNHNVTPENLREIIEEMKSESILKHKLEDATLIYGGYEDAIAGRYLDTTDHLKLYTSKMGEATFIPGAEFWLHGFDYLSPAVMDAVTELARHADSVNLVLTGDIGGIEDVDTRELNTTGSQKLKAANTQELNTAGALSSKDKFEDKRILAHRPDFRKTGNDPLFLLTNSLATALVRQAGDAGIQASADAIPSDAASGYLQELPPEIAHIERTLFTRPHTPYIEEVGLSNSGGEVRSHEAEQRVILQNGQSGRDVVLDSKRNLANDGAVSLTGNGAIFPTDDRAVLPAENAAVPTLRLIAAANYYAEAETAAAEVCALVRDGIDISGGARSGIRYRDILVLCNDMAERGPIIKQVFQRYGLPVFMDRRRSVEHNPVVEFILALPRITASGRRYEEVFTLLKTGLTDMDSDEVCELENYVIRFNIRGRRWDRDFTLGLKREEADGRVKGDYTQEELDALNASRQKVATLISAFEKRFKGGRAAKERTGALLAFLTEQAKLPEMIDHYKTTLEDAGMLEYAAEMAGMWDVVTEILDQMGTVLGDLPMSMDEYATVLRTGLDAIRIGVLPTVMDQVVLGTMQRTRSGGAKAVFVLGANDGVLPASPQSGAILSEDEIYRLADAGHNVARTEDTTHMEEELAIYRNLSKPRVLLRVSYAASDSAGKTIGPSPVFERLRRLFPETPVEKDMRNAAIHALPEQLPTGLCNDIAVPLVIQHPDQTLDDLSERLRAYISGEVLPDAWKDVIAWYHDHRPHALARIKAGLTFRGRRERVDAKFVEALYRKVTSPSALEKYSRCPFSWFMAYGIGLKERRVYGADSRSVGDIYHNVLMRFGRELSADGLPARDERSRWHTVTDSEIEEMATRLTAEEYAKLEAQYRSEIIGPGAGEDAGGAGEDAGGAGEDSGGVGEDSGVADEDAGDTDENSNGAGEDSGDTDEYANGAGEDPGVAGEGSNGAGEDFGAAGEGSSGADEDSGAADDDAETALGNYRCGRMTRTIAAAARILTQQIRDGSVDDIYFESAFGKGSDFPAITAIQTTGGDSGEEIRIEGRIDRVDILEGGFARITDYKSGAQEFSVPDAAAGYQLQLMIYLQAVSERFQPAGVFYFRIKEPRVEDDGSSNVAEKIMKSMKPDGVAVNDARILTAMGIDPDGRSKKNRMAPGEWDALRDTVGVLLKELIGNLSSGRVEAAPKTAVKLKTLASRNQKACDYCPYKGICNYDPAF